MIKHISLGTTEVYQYDYFGESLPLRPISSVELDECFYNTLKFLGAEVSNLVVKLKLSLVKPKEEIELDNQKLAVLQKYYNEVDYWIVFFAMKDFQDEEFSTTVSGIPKGFHLVKKMRKVHEIAKIVLGFSYQPEEVIKEIIKSDEGEILANVIFTLNVPLTEISKMTKLQRDFLLYSRKNMLTPKKKLSKTGDIVDLRKMLGGLI